MSLNSGGRCREALRRKSKGLGKLAREGLVPDDERQLDDLRRREVFLEPREALVGDLEVVTSYALAEFERGTLPFVEVRAFSIGSNVREFLCRDARFHADGVADVHSEGHPIERSHLDIQQRA